MFDLKYQKEPEQDFLLRNFNFQLNFELAYSVFTPYIKLISAF